MLKRVGLYSWAGPGTERIIKTKYFNPIIDHESLFHSYDFEYLARLKKLFGITDAWVSYSWGFSDSKEKENYNFVLNRLQNLKKLGIKTHAYLQGCNLVYEDFKQKDFWCRDEKGRLISYYRGRKVACVNNPNFRNFFDRRLKSLCKYPFDGIYIDNIQMGQLGIPMKGDTLPFVFAGCRCIYCQKKFSSQYDANIPTDLEGDISLTRKFMTFRVQSLHGFVSSASKIVHSHKKVFGTNSYDPKFNTRNVYGFDIYELQKYQDYLLFENHSLKEDSIDNSYIDRLKLKQPVFIVSYKKGIGFEKQYSQNDFNLIYSEARNSGFFPLLKASEYTTKGIWHNLRLNSLKNPIITAHFSRKKENAKQSVIIKLLQLRFIRTSRKPTITELTP